MTVFELEEKIKQASQAYYEGNPIMSDKDFDALIVYLKSANPNSELLDNVGWGYDPFKQIGEKEKHIYGKVTGIDKKPRTIEEIPKNLVSEYSDLFLSAKLDGLSMICYFINGRFTKAITRGNGEYGINRTDKVQKILERELNIPDNFDFTGAIRGEIVISHDNWKKMLDNELVTKDQNQRNVAAGIINRDEILDDINYVDLIFYKVVGFEIDENSIFNEGYHDNVLHNRHDCEFLSNFIKPEYLVDYISYSDLPTHEVLESLYNQFCSKYLCDGVVITSIVRNLIGHENKFSDYIEIINNEVAYKFITESAITTVENIRWKMSKGNKAIPVINVTPVELSGATISNASAYNAKFVYDNDLGIGSKVELIRSGEVIPKIVNVISISTDNCKQQLDNMSTSSNDLQGVCVTGKLSVPRKEFEEFLKSNGYKLMQTVSKNTKVLITSDLTSGSSKNQQADKLGITKMTEEEFRESLDNFKYSNSHIL